MKTMPFRPRVVFSMKRRRGGKIYAGFLFDKTEKPFKRFISAKQALIKGLHMITALLHKIYVSNCKLVVVNIKSPVDEIQRPSPMEKEIRLEQRFSLGYFNNPKHDKDLIRYYRDYGDIGTARALFDYGKSGVRVIKKDGITVLADCASQYYNVRNGDRLTTDNPEEYAKTIHIFGNATAGGARAEDKYTVASHLQRIINEESKLKMKVVNHANWQGLEDTCLQILSPLYTFSMGDFVVVIGEVEREPLYRAMQSFTEKNFVFYIDLSGGFQRPHRFGEIFFDIVHMQHNGYNILSQKIFKFIRLIMENEDGNKEYSGENKEPLQEYINFLRSVRISSGDDGRCYGCIAMNANPFTKGHQYLVDEALKRCDFLYVLVLEEDKSAFSFQNRINIVRRNLEGYKNVKVIPSGKFVISSLTMPEYFTKEEKKDIQIDASKDLLLFCRVVAKELHVTKRFVGNEPFCNITRQYNASMHAVLPRYGIDVVEIKRFSDGEQCVSASAVRRFIKNKEYDKLKSMVSDATYEYLAEHDLL